MDPVSEHPPWMIIIMDHNFRWFPMIYTELPPKNLWICQIHQNSSEHPDACRSKHNGLTDPNNEPFEALLSTFERSEKAGSMVRFLSNTSNCIFSSSKHLAYFSLVIFDIVFQSFIFWAWDEDILLLYVYRICDSNIWNNLSKSLSITKGIFGKPWNWAHATWMRNNTCIQKPQATFLICTNICHRNIHHSRQWPIICRPNSTKRQFMHRQLVQLFFAASWFWCSFEWDNKKIWIL